MDNQLILLQDIKSAVWILIYLVGAGVAVNILRAVAASYRTIKSELSNTFYNSVSAMFESGKYEALIEYCHEHIKKKPREAYAYWFLGKTYFQNKNYDKAVENFNKAIEIYPSWKKDWVGPYIEQIESERKSPLTNRST
jgi:tetratricopeptide (TPR) repeat protein